MPSNFLERMHHLIQKCIIFGLKMILGLFFRDILKRGSHQIPHEGPVIFVIAPHANQFVDPLIVMDTSPREVRFLMAASSMRSKIFGFFGRILGCIPVERPMDLSTKGSGQIRLAEMDGRIVEGKGCQFLNELTINHQIAIISPPNAHNYPIAEIYSDNRIRLEDSPNSQVRIPLDYTDYFIIPKIKQSCMYQSVIDCLGNGECIGIFPEGGSHDRAEMLPLKAGVSLIALGAMAKYSDLKVTIVPCGLNYFNPDKFRSRAMVEFGVPINIEPELIDLFKEGNEQKREACGILLNKIYIGLSSVTINVPDHETLQVLQAIRRLYQPSEHSLNSFELLEITRRFIKGFNTFKRDSKIISLQNSILKYNETLAFFGLKDHQVRTLDFRKTKALLLLFGYSILLLIYAMLFIPGFLLNLPGIVISKLVSKYQANKAVHDSHVKLKGRDVVATWKIITGLFLFPLLYAIYTLVAFRELVSSGLIAKNQYIYAVLIFLLFPSVSIFTLKIGEVGYRIFHAIKPLCYSVFSPRYGEVIRGMRYRLKREIINIVNEYGPKLIEDFENKRIVPSRRFSKNLFSDAAQLPEMDGSDRDGVSEEDSANSLQSTDYIDDLNSVMADFQYMRANVNLFSNFKNRSKNANWSHVDPIEIDDIFFIEPESTSKSKKDI